MKSRSVTVSAALVVALAAPMLSVAGAMPLIGHDPAAERGARIAARECSGCHAVDLQGASPKPAAPPFRDVRRRYNEISLAREFETISQVGHYEMPPKPISKADGEDLIAFIESLGR
jgi:mono/diheme cytochrome c family protein